MKRFLLISLLVVGILVLGGVFYVRHYLHSPQVANQVATQIESLYGGPVHIESADVGMGSSEVHGFALFEPGADPKTSKPWLKVGSLTTDLSLWDIIRGTAVPKHVTITGARMVLYFDADGRLITRFPTPAENKYPSDLSVLKELPDVVVEHSELVLRKAGQPELVAHHVSAHLSRGDDGAVILSGTADNVELGKLLLSGSIDTATHEAAVRLNTERTVHVTQPLLNRLPFIPRALWQEIRIDQGETPATLTVRYNLANGPLRAGV